MSRKKGTRKSERRQPVQQRETTLPANVRETFERGVRLFEELQDGVTLEDAIERRRRALRDLLARFDAVHLLGQLGA